MTWTPERAKEYGRAWYQENRVEQLARAKARHAANPEARRASWLRVRLRTYGLTLEQYEKMLRDQGHKCLICEVLEHEAPKGRLAVDHCHATGKVRGLLCNNCNALLGMAKDSPRILEQARVYLCG